MANILTRLLTLPFTLISLIFTRLLRFRGAPHSVRLANWTGSRASSGILNGEDSRSDDTDDTIIDPRVSSEYFVRYLVNHAGSEDAVDEAMWSTKAGYNAALQQAKETNMILLVVLVSKEHDNNASFIRHTLASSSFKSLMHEHRDSILLWGGDVCTSRDAHITSMVLQAATYPFMAFIALQPVAASRIASHVATTSTSSKMRVFSRLEGLSSTSIPSLRAHMIDTLLPRLAPYLNRLKAQKRQRDAERNLREEQDRAYAEAGKRDLERVRAKEAELRQAKEAEDRKRLEEHQKASRKTLAHAWRLKTAAKIAMQPDTKDAVTKLVIRLPDGKRIIRQFAANESAAKLWHIVECEAHGISVTSPISTAPSFVDIADFQPDLAFSLATTFPRRVLSFTSVRGKSIGELIEEGMLDPQAGNLIVEGLVLQKDSGDTDSEEDEDLDDQE